MAEELQPETAFTIFKNARFGGFCPSDKTRESLFLSACCQTRALKREELEKVIQIVQCCAKDCKFNRSSSSIYFSRQHRRSHAPLNLTKYQHLQALVLKEAAAKVENKPPRKAWSSSPKSQAPFHKENTALKWWLSNQHQLQTTGLHRASWQTDFFQLFLFRLPRLSSKPPFCHFT